MIYLALGGGLLWLLLFSQDKRPILKHAQWRVASAVVAVLAFAGAALLSLRGDWPVAIVLLVIGLWTAASARHPRAARAKAATVPSEAISISEAYAILDLKPGCTREDVQAAYQRLMKVVHPDRGGGEGLAAKLNAARDRLLK
jgi:hypothetical protein